MQARAEGREGKGEKGGKVCVYEACMHVCVCKCTV